MKIVVFDQWDKLMAKFRSVASGAATAKSQYDLVRLEPKGGRVQLADRSANNLAISGGETTIVMPDIEPGKARDFMLRVEATGENTLIHLLEGIFAKLRNLVLTHIPNLLRLLPAMPLIDNLRSQHCPHVNVMNIVGLAIVIHTATVKMQVQGS